MATISLHSISFGNPCRSRSFRIPILHSFQTHGGGVLSPKQQWISSQKLKSHGIRKLRSEEEETLLLQQQVESSSSPVSVPLSPSYTLTMFFQAEGAMSESVIPLVTGALELAKQTTLQASGEASSLVEIIQGLGFKLQTLKLSFKDEEEIFV